MQKNEQDIWWRHILWLCNLLCEQDIPYHLDGSTALFVQGSAEEMDDLDITIQPNCFVRTHALFAPYSPCEIQVVDAELSHFFFFIDGRKFHFLSYGDENVRLSQDPERIPIMHNGQTVIAKSLSFFEQRSHD